MLDLQMKHETRVCVCVCLFALMRQHMKLNQSAPKTVQSWQYEHELFMFANLVLFFIFVLFLAKY